MAGHACCSSHGPSPTTPLSQLLHPMPVRASAPTLTRHGPLNQYRSHVWISDELLSHAFASFSCRTLGQCKRRNSTVPGPLEASRRLSKRRMNNLCIATEAGRSSPIDNHSLVLDWFDNVRSFFRDQHWKWEAPSLPQYPKDGPSMVREASSNTSHPSLTSITAHLPVAWSITNEEAYKGLADEAHVDVAPHSLSQVQELAGAYSTSEYLQRLHEVSDLTTLRQLRAECSMLPVDVAQCSVAEFEHLLKIRARFADLLQYLEDPILNHACGVNMSRFVEHFAHRQATAEQCEVIVRKVHGALQGRILTKHEKTKTLQLFPLVLLNAYGAEDLSAILNGYRALLNVGQSDYTKEPLSDMILYRLILRHLIDLPQGPQTNFALLLLQSALPLHFVKPGSAMGSSLVKLAIHLIQPKKTETPISEQSRNVEALSEAFDSLPLPFVKRWINAIVLYSAKRKTGQKPLEVDDDHLMSATLSAMRLSIHFSKDVDDDLWTLIYTRALSVSQPSQIRDHLARLGPQRHALVVLRHWLGKHSDMNYTKRYRRSRGRRLLKSIKHTPMASDVERVLHQYHSQLPQLDISISWPIALVRAMRHFGRSPSRITAYYLEFFLALEDHISFDAFAKCVRGFLGVKLPGQILHRFLSLSTTSARTALLHLQLNDNISVDTIPGVQRGFMLNQKIRSKRILGLLFRTSKEKPHPTNARVNLVRAAAVDFACVPRFKWHLGYRNVRSCVQYLVEAGVGVDALLSRALVVVGLLRPLNEGIRLPERHVRDVLEMVAFIEGPEVASRLEREVYSRQKDWSEASGRGIYLKKLKVDTTR